MKRTLFILTALFGLLFSSFSALAYDCKVDGIYYNLNKTDKTASVVSNYYGVYSGNIIIPETITYNNTTYSVTSIGDRAFDQCSGLTSVTIGNSVKSIGESAFAYCSGLTSVTIGNSVTSIGDRAFDQCSGLTSVTIPNSVTTIGEEVFGNCSRLNSVIVDKNNGTYDSRDNCNAIIKTSTNKLIVGCKNTTIPNSVTSIGDRAFYGCSELTSVTIPNSVTSIGESAFYGCSGLTSAIIGNSVKSIGESAFDSCSGLTSVTIGNSVKSIGEDAFSDCFGLTSATIGNSVKYIGQDAFAECSMLESITIPNSVISIGEQAFECCSGLTSITIPNSVISIGCCAFSGCSGLTSLVVDKNNDTYDSRDNCNAIIRTSTNRLIVGCKNTTIPSSVKTIGESAFDGCTGLTSVTIPNSVTTIGEYAFSECTGLTKLVSLAVKPPSCGYEALRDIDKTACRLFVPEESVNKYKTADQWEEFLYISEYDGVDDVSIGTPDAVYEVYNLQGVRVGSGMHEAEINADVLSHGVYILVSPQGRKKVKI